MPAVIVPSDHPSHGGLASAPDPWQPTSTGGGRSGHRRVLLLILAVVTLLGAAAFLLTQDDDDPRRQEYVDAIASTGTTADLPGADQTTYWCLAEVVVDVVGVERLAAAATPEQIRSNPDWGALLPGPTEAEASEMADGMFGCWDVRGAMEHEIATRGVDPATAGCLTDQLSDQQLRDMLVGALLDDQQAASEFSTAMAEAESECGLP